MSVTFARGWRAAGVAAGVKPSGRPDVALVVSDRPAAAAGTFTTNAACAAPVVASRRRLAARGAPYRAVVANAGNANACTGPKGLDDAEAMCAAAARVVGSAAAEVLVASTGVVGVPLPIDRVIAGIEAAGRAVSPDGGAAAADAITTTDTRPKTATATCRIGGVDVRVGGMAKGAGMIHPEMAPAAPAHATLLSFITTDAEVEPAGLSNLLQAAVDRSFHAITIDGDTSTNDTVLLLANGASGARAAGADLAGLARAVEEVCIDLARQVAFDGEGATKCVEIVVTGARSEAEARSAGRAVGRSNLVKCALWGEDPNWGRILAAVGSSGAALDLSRARIAVGGVVLYAGGPAPCDPDEARRSLKRREIRVEIDLGMGTDRGRVWTCDLTPEYVRFNGAYTT